MKKIILIIIVLITTLFLFQQFISEKNIQKDNENMQENLNMSDADINKSNPEIVKTKNEDIGENFEDKIIKIEDEIIKESEIMNEIRLETYIIEPQKVPCDNLNSENCLVVNGKPFYEKINNFNFKEGFNYELLVEIIAEDTQNNNNLTYNLIEILKEEPIDINRQVNYNLDGTKWTFNEGEIKFENGYYEMSFGCNILKGKFLTKNENIFLEIPVSTGEECSEEIMEKEYKFSDTITRIENYTQEDEYMIFSGDRTQIMLQRVFQ